MANTTIQNEACIHIKYSTRVADTSATFNEFFVCNLLSQFLFTVLNCCLLFVLFRALLLLTVLLFFIAFDITKKEKSHCTTRIKTKGQCPMMHKKESREMWRMESVFSSLTSVCAAG